MENGLVCRRVSMDRRFGAGATTPVLRGISARFPAGCISEVAGPNGAGKSTLLHVMAGLLRPTEGEVRWNGAPVSRWSAGHRDRWRRQVGIVFQDLHLIEDLTALENVMAPLIPRGLSAASLREAGQRALAQTGAADLAPLTVRALSGGQRQRVAIARAVVDAPALLLADEPAAHQDEEGKALIRTLLAELKRRGAAVVVAGRPEPVLYESAGPDLSYRLEGGALKGPA